MKVKIEVDRLTIGELKKAVENLPDEMLIYMQLDDDREFLANSHTHLTDMNGDKFLQIFFIEKER